MGLKSGDKVAWRFVEFSDVPRGPWSRFGDNNPFVNRALLRRPKVAPASSKSQRTLRVR